VLWQGTILRPLHAAAGSSQNSLELERRNWLCGWSGQKKKPWISHGPGQLWAIASYGPALSPHKLVGVGSRTLQRLCRPGAADHTLLAGSTHYHPAAYSQHKRSPTRQTPPEHGTENGTKRQKEGRINLQRGIRWRSASARSLFPWPDTLRLLPGSWW